MSAGLIDAMRAAGLQPAKVLELATDGKLQRFKVEGDKPGSRNGWVVLHGHPIMAGAFGSWKTGESHSWREATSKPLTPADRAELARSLKAQKAAQAAEREVVQAEARAKAQRLWARARPATSAHPYLERKGVHGWGIRQLNDMLLIPARDVNGVIHTVQFISADGSKRFLTGGRKAGCYFAIGKVANSLLLAEGVATGCTLYQATGAAVAVCFDCGNLLAVALALRGKFPRLRLVVCADNDAATPGNPGLTHATAAARAVGGFVAVPQFQPATS